MGERRESLMRILVGIVSGIVLGLWRYLVSLLFVVHFFYVLITGKRHKGIAEHVNKWVNFQYRFERYLQFTTNDRPFPFNKFHDILERVDMKKKK